MGPCSNGVENAESRTEGRAQDGTVSRGLWHAGTPPVSCFSENSPDNSFLVDWFINFTGIGRCTLEPRGRPGSALF